MTTLYPSFLRRLQPHHVRVDTPDANTVNLYRVPLNEKYFSKGFTNLLSKILSDGSPVSVLGVDEDLLYTGGAPEVAAAFSGGHHRDGWLVLLRPRHY